MRLAPIIALVTEEVAEELNRLALEAFEGALEGSVERAAKWQKMIESNGWSWDALAAGCVLNNALERP